MGLTMDAEPRSARRIRLPDGSRSVSSPWVWRGMLFLSLIALGLCISFAESRQDALHRLGRDHRRVVRVVHVAVA